MAGLVDRRPSARFWLPMVAAVGVAAPPQRPVAAVEVLGPAAAAEMPPDLVRERQVVPAAKPGHLAGLFPAIQQNMGGPAEVGRRLPERPMPSSLPKVVAGAVLLAGA